MARRKTKSFTKRDGTPVAFLHTPKPKAARKRVPGMKPKQRGR